MSHSATEFESQARRFVLAAEKAIHFALNGQLRVLLVDDNPTDIQMFKVLLESVESRYVVEVANTSSNAMDIIREQRHDLVVMDWHLSHGAHTGLGIVSAMQAEGVFFPFVIWSGSEEDYMEAGRKNCLSWIDKLHVTPASLDADLLLAFKSHFQQMNNHVQD